MVKVRIAEVRMDLANGFAATRAAGEAVHAATIAGRERNVAGIDFDGHIVRERWFGCCVLTAHR